MVGDNKCRCVSFDILQLLDERWIGMEFERNGLKGGR